MKKYKPYLISLVITFIAAGIGAAATYAGMDGFMKLSQPLFSPPSFLFPVVWTILYILMSLAAARVYVLEGKRFTTPVKLYAVQLFFNMVWSILFFGFGAYLAAFIWLVILWVLVLLMIMTFYPVCKGCAFSQIPYLMWLSFAAYLNFGIYYLNT